MLNKAAFTLMIAIATASSSIANSNVAVSSIWARTTSGPNGAVFMEIENDGQESDRLISAETKASNTVELHTHITEGNIKRMRPVAAIDVPAGEMVVLKPGGLHVMLMGVKKPLKEGDSIELTLNFEKSGQQVHQVPVRKKQDGCGCQCKVDHHKD